MSEDTYTGDPTDPLSLNLYTYCHNEPLMFIDPTGHEYILLRQAVESLGADINWNAELRSAVDFKKWSELKKAQIQE